MVSAGNLLTTTTTLRGEVYESAILCSRKHLNPMENSRVLSGIKRPRFGHIYMNPSFFTCQSYVQNQRDIRAEAGWLFRGGDNQELNASFEKSDSTNEDILIFFFQLDLATRVQCALNMEQYEMAQQLRNKLTEVEGEVIKQLDLKRGSSAKTEAQDKAIRLLRLRADLQNAIEDENYTLAAELRDKVSQLETDSLAASAKALAYEHAQYEFRLGQKLTHKIFGYRGVICGMDPVCCESSSWMETAHVQELSRGSNQPFYQVLVDSDPDLLVTYVAEENLVVPEQPDLDEFNHPYVSFLFYGMDAVGDFIPIKQLREKFNRHRHEDA